MQIRSIIDLSKCLTTGTRLAAFVAVAQVAQVSAETVHFDADFDDTPLTDLGSLFGAEITKANLDAGTAVGEWTVHVDQGAPPDDNWAFRQIQGAGGEDVENKALRFGINLQGSGGGGQDPILTAHLDSFAPVGGNNVTVGFDYANASPDGGTGGRTFFLRGVDGDSRTLFELAFKSTGPANSAEQRQLAYRDGESEIVLIGNPGDVESTQSRPGESTSSFDPEIMKRIEVVIGEDSFDVLLDGEPLEDAVGIAFQDPEANGVSRLDFASVTPWTGGWFDNMTVTSVGAPVPTFGLVITPAVEPATGYDLTWESQAGKLYNVRTSTDLAGPISEWDLIENEIAATPPSNTYNVPEDGPRRFYAVEEFDAPPPPPVYFEDFEESDGGFTIVGSPNDWQWGTPDSNNDAGLVLTTGNNESENCWGTNLGTGDIPSGLINPGANSILRSPEIDLGGVTGAELSFAAAYDAQADDVIEILIIDTATGDPIGDPIEPIDTSDEASSDWVELGPFDISEADGSNIHIEFHFTGLSELYIGLYIDDVSITAEP